MATTSFKTPDWLVANVFESLLKTNLPQYERIIDFTVQPAVSAGENYATQILRIKINVELNDKKTKDILYVMKVPIDNEMLNKLREKHNIFDIESGMFLDIIPEFEEMYKNAGKDIKIGPQCFKLNLEHDQDAIVLDDLCPKGFKNANRLEGLDMEHTKCVLKKLAQWHAASATRVEIKGKFSDGYAKGYFTSAQGPILKDMFENVNKTILPHIKTYKNSEIYYDALIKLGPTLTDKLFALAKSDPKEFNVLNHGDCWVNNVMFQYDAFGNIKETYLVDYQVPKYGSPAQDLLYFIISSTNYNIKLKEFDFFIKFYHDNLIENLTILKYPKAFPSLKDIHSALYKYGLWGYVTAQGVLAAALLEPNEEANLNNFLGDSDESKNFKSLMYTNPTYQAHMEIILPWLHNRGALEA